MLLISILVADLILTGGATYLAFKDRHKVYKPTLAFFALVTLGNAAAIAMNL